MRTRRSYSRSINFLLDTVGNLPEVQSIEDYLNYCEKGEKVWPDRKERTIVSKYFERKE